MAQMVNGGTQPIIIKKIKKGGGGHHGGAWKVAYADFVTAMMAFFLVMWIVGLDKPTRQAIEAYFKDPYGFMKGTPGSKTPLASSDSIKIGISTPVSKKVDLPTLQAAFAKVKAEIAAEMEKSPELSGLKESVSLKLTDEGLRIELMEKTASLFFDTGSARLKDRTRKLLAMIGKELKKLDNPIMIEGHTDSRPLGAAGGYSNWELSTDRANSARRIIESSGVNPKDILSVRGYADHKLLRPNDPTHFSNRRVSILVAYVKKDEY
jgi:chemotaxis protein MotB